MYFRMGTDLYKSLESSQMEISTLPASVDRMVNGASSTRFVVDDATRTEDYTPSKSGLILFLRYYSYYANIILPPSPTFFSYPIFLYYRQKTFA